MAPKILMTCQPCTAHLTLADLSGRRIEGDAGATGPSTIKRKVAPGTYYVWAGAFAGEVGVYRREVGVPR